jgi:hypothetical protein
MATDAIAGDISARLAKHAVDMPTCLAALRGEALSAVGDAALVKYELVETPEMAPVAVPEMIDQGQEIEQEGLQGRRGQQAEHDAGAEERHGQVLSGNQPQGREHHEQVVLQRRQSHKALRKRRSTWII